MVDQKTHRAHEHPPTKEENVDKEVVLVRPLCECCYSESHSATLEGVFSAWWQGHRLAQQLALHVSFSIFLLSVFIWSPQPVMLQFVGTKEVTETA